MPPLLLILLVGGGAWVLSRVAGGERSNLRGPRMALVSATRNPEDAERFQDALYECYGTGPKSGLTYRWRYWDDGGEKPIGYEYLSGIPNTADARIGRIRQKIREYRAVTPRKDVTPTPREPLDIYKYASSISIDATATALSVFTDYKKVLETIPGIPIEAAKEKAAGIANVLTKNDAYLTLEKAAREIPPIAIAAGRGVLKAIGIVIDSQMTESEKTIAGLNLAADVAALVPVYGTAVSAAAKFVLSFWEAQNAADRGEAEEKCRNIKIVINDVYKKTADFQLPIPWHAQETFSANCPSNLKEFYGYSTKNQLYLIGVLERSLAIFLGKENGVSSVNQYLADIQQGEGFKNPDGTPSKGFPDFFNLPPAGLSQEQRNYVKRWWATATMLMGNPNVSDVFDALGRDAFGGIIASDEQVMLVAAPIATSRGWDVDEFARALFNFSEGWRSATGGFVRRRYQEHTDFVAAWSWDEKRHDLKRETPCTGSDGKLLVRNAWWLNWAVLARDAFILAESFIPSVPVPDRFADTAISDKVNLSSGIESKLSGFRFPGR